MRRPLRKPHGLELEDITNYEATCDYLVYVDGTSYVAINGDTGAELSRGADAATVINLALAKTGCIYLKSGTYPIRTMLRIPSNTTLRGCGWNTIFQKHADLSDNHVISNTDTGTGNTNVELIDFAIDGNDSAHAEGSYGIQFTKVTRGRVKGLYIKDTGTDAIICKYSHYINVSDIVTDNPGNHTVFVGYGSTYCIVDNIISKDPKTEHVCVEYQDTGADNMYITISNVVGFGAQNQGIYIQHAQHISINNCLIYDTINSGIYLRDCDSVVVANCIVDKTTTNDRSCFETIATASNVLITNCAAYRPENGACSAYMLRGTRITLSNSLASACNRGVETSITESDFIHVYGCTFEDYAWGILIMGDYIRYHDNVFSNPNGAVAYCFYKDTSTNIEIYNNDVRAACTGAEIRNYLVADDVYNNIGWKTEGGGVSAVIADGATVAHGLAVTPTYVTISGSVAGEIVNVTAIGAANFTVAIKTNAGAAGTNQAIYWRAWE